MRERKSAFQGTPNTHTQQATPMNLLGLGLQGRGTAGWAEISTLTLYSWCFTDLLKGQQRWDSVSGFSYSQGGSEGHDCEVAWESPSQGQGHGLDHGEPLQTTSPSSTEKAGGGEPNQRPQIQSPQTSGLPESAKADGKNPSQKAGGWGEERIPRASVTGHRGPPSPPKRKGSRAPLAWDRHRHLPPTPPGTFPRPGTSY